MDRVEVEWVCSPQAGASLQRLVLSLPVGARAGDALAAAGFAEVPAGWALAVWGRKVGHDEALRSGDRVELVRPLTVDPKETRRRRQAHQARPVSRHRAPPRRPRLLAEKL